MELTKSENIIKKVAAILGIIQGSTWAIMSFICVILYLKDDKLTEPTSFMGTVQAYIYIFYFTKTTGNQQQLTNPTLTPVGFHVFMWIYFFENLLWVGASIFLLRRNTFKTIKEWALFTIFMSALDFILFTILGSDYNKCLSSAQDFGGFNQDNVIQVEGICANSILIMFVIAAKGFTLWVFNIAMAGVLYKIGDKLQKGS